MSHKEQQEEGGTEEEWKEPEQDEEEEEQMKRMQVIYNTCSLGVSGAGALNLALQLALYHVYIQMYICNIVRYCT